MDQATMRELFENAVGFVKRSVLKALVLEPGRVRLQMPMAGNENHIGYMYAGALFTLAEVPGGALFITTWDFDKFYPVVKSLNIDFVRPTMTDATIELNLDAAEAARIAAEAEAKGKCEFILEGEILDAEGKVTATSRGVYQIRKHGM